MYIHLHTVNISIAFVYISAEEKIQRLPKRKQSVLNAILHTHLSIAKFLRGLLNIFIQGVLGRYLKHNENSDIRDENYVSIIHLNLFFTKKN